MKIRKVTKLKSGKYKLDLDNKDKIITYDNVILDNNLLFNPLIDNNLLSKINKENKYYDIYNKIIKMVGTRLRSEKEIKEFLLKNALDDKEIENIISDLKKQKIIDDVKFVRAFIHDKLAFTNYGPNKIKSELLNHVDNEIIDEELNNIEPSIFDEKMRKIVSKKISQNHKYSKLILKKKLTDELKMQGFDAFDIDEFLVEDDDILKKECLKLYEKLSKKYSDKELILKMKQKLYQKGFSMELVNKEIEELNI